MPHHHEHEHHHHAVDASNMNRAFIIGIVLNSVFVVVEFGAGFIYNSLALLSDAGHNLSDVAALALSLFAFKLAKAKSNERFTYGYQKSTILASLANAVILLIVVGAIGWAAIQRFMTPEAINGKIISIVAAVGIVINAVSAFLFFREKEKDLNVKGAYLHMATDALVSIGVVVTGILITYTGIEWLDPLISLVIMIIVLYSTWGLLKESARLSMDAVPERIDIEDIKKVANEIQGIINIHHIHVWAMSTTINALTAHICIDSKLSLEDTERIKHQFKHKLEHLNIRHATLETESGETSCADVH